MKLHFKYVVGISCALSSAIYADIHDRIEYKLNRVLKDVEVIINGNEGTCTPINQHLIDANDGTFIAAHSGPYCLMQDVIGTIILAVDNVCLDLGCHKVDAGGADVAIQVLGNDCSIQNGTLSGTSGATSTLVSAVSVNGFRIDNVNFSDFHSIGLYGDSLTSFKATNCTFTNGDEAIFLTGCNEGTLQGHKLFNLINREPSNLAIIHLTECDCMKIFDLEIFGNHKDYGILPSDPFSGVFFRANNCREVFLDNVCMNNTQPVDTNPGSAALGIVAAAFISCDSLLIKDSIFTMHNNAAIMNAAGLVLYQSQNAMLENSACYNTTNFAGAGTVALGFVVVSSSDIRVDSCQFSKSVCPMGGGAAGAFVVVGSSSIYFNDCQFSDNNAGMGGGSGIGFFESFNCAVIDCVAYGNPSNSIDFENGNGYSVVNFAGDAQFTVFNTLNCSFEKVNIHDNASGSAFSLSNSQAILLKNCETMGCSSGNGFFFFNGCSNLELEGCSALTCAGSGFNFDSSASVLLKSSQAVGNSLFGFAFPANASNNTITNCIALSNGTGNYSIDVPAPLIFTVDNAGLIVGVSDYFHNLSRV